MESVRLYEVLTDEEAGSPATVEARRLTTAAKVNAALGQDENANAEQIEAMIDQVSGECARFCGITRPATGVAVPGFGRETIRVTWLRATRERRSPLILPWRVPIVSIESLTEDAVELTEGTDFQCAGAGLLLRFANDLPSCWSTAKIIAELTVGWELPDGVPAELEGRVIEQVKMAWLGRDQNPAIRSETLTDTYAATYAVAGGDSIGESGLLKSLENALAPFRNPAV